MNVTTSSDRTSGQATERVINGFNVDQFTSAPLRHIKTVHLNVKPENIFSRVTDHTKLCQWIPLIRRCTIDYSNTQGNQKGVGTIRSCRLGNDYIKEEIVHWDPPRSCAYTLVNNALAFNEHLSIFTIEHDRPDQLEGSLVTWRQYYNVMKTPRGFLTALMMKNITNKALKNLIGEFGGKIVKLRS